MLPVLSAWSERIGWKAEVASTDFDNIDYDKKCDVVGLSAYTHLASQNFLIAKRFRERGKIVVLGGPHTRGCVEESRDHVDVVFDRCNEESWHNFLRAVEYREIIPSRDRGIFFPSQEMSTVPPYIEYKKFYDKKKIPMLLSSLGCPHICDFCVDWDSKYYKRSIDEVIEDVHNIDKSLFVFCDPNFGVNKKITSELLRKMVPLKKRYVMESSLAFLCEDEYLELLRDSGCIAVEVGIESLSTTFKKNAVKGDENLIESTMRQIMKIKKYIPLVQVNIVFGLDDDTEETFHSVVKFHQLSEADSLVPHILTPFPGTPLWDQMQNGKRIFEKEWCFFDTGNLVFSPKKCDPFNFYCFYIDMLKKINSPLAILKKALKHYRKYKNARMALMLFSFLLQRSKNTFLYDIPTYRRAKERLVSENVKGDL